MGKDAIFRPHTLLSHLPHSPPLIQPFGLAPRPDALCPDCGSVERHRLVWLFFKHKTNLFDRSPKKMLHIAPEKALDENLRKTPALDYLTADLTDPRAMVRMDITDIPYPDNLFDVIYCSHVLEHVPDDRKAIRHLNRVLKPTGWAVFVVPIKVEKTIEDTSITDPADRRRLFGQHDHVRRYGPDFADRLAEAGFDVTTFSATDIATAETEVSSRNPSVIWRQESMRSCRSCSPQRRVI